MGTQSVHAKFRKNTLLGRLIPVSPGVIAVCGPNPFDKKINKDGNYTTVFGPEPIDLRVLQTKKAKAYLICKTASSNADFFSLINAYGIFTFLNKIILFGAMCVSGRAKLLLLDN